MWKVKPPDQLGPDEGPGAFRKHDILEFPDGMRPPPFTEVHGLVTDWVQDANKRPRADEHLLEQLARLHARFEQIHPFRDGKRARRPAGTVT